MIKEYALEPALLNTWDRFQRFISLFGVPRGRMISKYPKKWELLVLEALTCGDVERKRIEESLIRLKETALLPREQVKWTDAKNWVGNAMEEHNIRPFASILANTEEVGHSEVIDGSKLDVTALPQQLMAGPSCIVARSSSEMSRSLRPLLLISKKILIVDRYFSPENRRFCEPLKEMLQCFLDQYGRPRKVDIEIHISHRMLEKATNFGNYCQSLLEKDIPEGMQLTIVRWNHDELHNRYILTDRGGVQLGEGIVEANARASRSDDTLTLLSSENTSAYLDRYGGPVGLKKHLGRHLIVGSRKR